MKNSTKIFNGLYSVSEPGIRRTAIMLCTILVVMTSFVAYAKTDELVQKAFELRINGKTDQAKELLLTVLEKDSNNAAAHFELARTLNYINIMGSDEATKALKTAKDIEPKNLIYAYGYAKNCFFEAFKAMQLGNGDVKSLISKTCDEFINVLKLDPGYNEALMYLVEIYGILPENMGGDKIKAEEYAQKLEKQDKFYGAKARLVLMPEETDRVKYWTDFTATNTKDCRVWKELGVANLFAENVEAAKENFSKAMELDKTQNIRLLDLSRYHQMKVMQNRDAAKQELPKSKVYINQYLATTPEPIPPLKAYAIGILARIEMFSGNNAEGEKLMAEAKQIDPYFSQAFGIPMLSIFESPDKPDHHFVSFFSPF